MFRVIGRSAPAALAYLALTGAAQAQSRSWSSWWSSWTDGDQSGGSPFSWREWTGSGSAHGHGSSSVPEIDASTGLLTLAVVAAALALAWELKRRRMAS